MWLVSFTTRPLYSWVRAPGTHSIGSWEDPRFDLDTMAKGKNPINYPRRELNPDGTALIHAEIVRLHNT